MLSRGLSRGWSGWSSMAAERREKLSFMQRGVRFMLFRRLAFGFVGWQTALGRLRSRGASDKERAARHMLNRGLARGLGAWLDLCEDAATGRALQRRALWLLRTAIGRHTPEEEVVVDVAAAGVADATLDPGILDLIHVLKKLVDAHFGQVLLVGVGPQFGEGGVQFVRVGLMMLEVVDAHGGGIDVGLQRLVVVWDRWQGLVLRERHAVQQRDHRSDKRSRRLDAASRSQTHP